MNFIKKNVKLIIGFIIGVILASTITVYATSYLAKDIIYKNEKNVEEALNELYIKTSELDTLKTKISQTDATENDILSGKKAYSTGGLITGTNTQFDINPQKLHQVNGVNKISTTTGNKYIISITVGSYTNQNYVPSIASGCTIIKENDLISATYGGWVNYSKSYVVTATSNEIVFSGNAADYSWNHITYYEV